MEGSVPVMADTRRLDWNINLVLISVTFVLSLKSKNPNFGPFFLAKSSYFAQLPLFSMALALISQNLV